LRNKTSLIVCSVFKLFLTWMINLDSSILDSIDLDIFILTTYPIKIRRSARIFMRVFNPVTSWFRQIKIRLREVWVLIILILLIISWIRILAHTVTIIMWLIIILYSLRYSWLVEISDVWILTLYYWWVLYWCE